jgi:hypothetical protein
MTAARHVYASPAEAQRVREMACQNAALVMSSRPDEPITPGLWNLCTFFEAYITMGHQVLAPDWGPRESVVLKLVKDTANV